MQPAKSTDEFYVGYLPYAPEGLAKRMRKVILLLLGITAAIAFILVFSQNPFYPSVFEFGTVRSFEGVIREKPYPHLQVKHPGGGEGKPVYSSFYLVDFGKFGAEAAVKGLDGKAVRLNGALIYRDGQTMIEIAEGGISPRVETPPPAQLYPPGTSSGRFELTGEIVDSKCYLGVMNPGHLKPHAACAVRCISGGIPPLFVVQNANGATSYFLLVGEDGKTVNQAVLSKIAVPLRITGEVFSAGQDNLLLLKADPRTFERLD
jgi:hypothetical protein